MSLLSHHCLRPDHFSVHSRCSASNHDLGILVVHDWSLRVLAAERSVSVLPLGFNDWVKNTIG